MCERQSMEAELKSQAHRPSMQNQCSCSMCHKFKLKRMAEFLEQKKAYQLKVIGQITSGFRKKSHLKWILSRLTLPTNKTALKGLNIFVSEICFYQNGELSCFFLNKDIYDPTLKQISKERLTPTFFQKTINQRRWKYREHLQTKKGVVGKIDTKEAIVLQFRDGFEKLISEAEFTTILQKRRLDPFWNTVHSFRNFIAMKKGKQEGILIKYEEGSNINNQLFIRAKIVVKVSATQITECYKNYISDEDEEKYCNSLIEGNDEVRLFTYLSYKIINFIEQFYDTRITKGCFQWTLDQLKRPLLMDVKRLQYQQLIKYNWTPESIEKKEKANEDRIFYSKEISPLNPQSQTVSLKIEAQMRETFEQLKEYYGLSLKQEEDVEQLKNEEYFKRVYPDLVVNLDELRLMDIPAFKEKYLNDKPERRPMVGEFRPPMIRLLHNLTPGVKPKHKRSLSMTKPNYSGTRPMSYKNPSTRLNSGRSTINTTWYNTFHNQTKSINLFDF